ncbi:four helix bundle protein [Aporhodopirellula aestuarii]|uniref:Four helix bundle protein n=1 Tax=Aporhodopirellula aestuarii TaxID=2950107 RepID=A0ABT0U017_9BACT|nr:four helix bundle protein [Aporhodopirellula aestuarii]MCM2369969.1 four helix bundle protein [Aporhodopirellula aestuarii]
MKERISGHRDLIVYQKSFAAGKRIFELSQLFPREEMYSLTDQVRRSSRSVSANIAEAWRKRRYEKHFCSTLNVAESEAAETQVWLEYAAAHGYLDQETFESASKYYDEILRLIVAMIHGSSKWCVDFNEQKKKAGESGVGESGVEYVVHSDSPELDQQHLLAQFLLLPAPSSQLPPKANA